MHKEAHERVCTVLLASVGMLPTAIVYMSYHHLSLHHFHHWTLLICMQKAGGPAPVQEVQMKTSNSSSWNSMNNLWGILAFIVLPSMHIHMPLRCAGSSRAL